MIFLYGILCLAVVMDLFTFRISNRIILAGYLTGICYRWLTGGWIGTGRGILDAAVFVLAYRLIFKKTRKKAVIHFSIPILFGVIALQTGGSIL